MARRYIDCRGFPQAAEKKCTIAISADSEGELMGVAVQHAVAVHGYKDTPELRNQIRTGFRQGTPPA